MREVVFAPHIRETIKDFTAYRIAYFERVYSDTGIFGEDTIVDRYIEESDGLFEEFMSAIRNNIGLGVFGNIYAKKGSNEFSRLVVKPGSHILIVWLRRDRDADMVYVEDIEIQT